MSDLHGEQPLSRRERRLREMAETGQTPVVDTPEPVALAAPTEPEISPFNPDGTARSRRELRELREAALARAAAATYQPALVGEPEPMGEPAPAEEPVAPAEEQAQPLAEQTPSDAGAFNDFLAETQALTLEEIAEVESSANAEVSDTQDRVTVETDEGLESGPVSVGYSFPDIAPLDEGGSVFDDPAVRAVVHPTQASETPSSEFDDLISRAVAQEGAASATNTSALIMPSLPETDQISGPLGETGELFITGSFSLPKSLVETGGHASLLDTVGEDIDAASVTDASSTDASGMAPISAVRAVSARGAASGLTVAEPEKEKSKLPLILILSGGGLLVVIAGLAAWAISSGMFA